MRRPLTICAVTGSRADYGLLKLALLAIAGDAAFRLKLIVTGQHLVASAGDTVAQIREDGFDIAAEIDMALNGDDPVTITKGSARILDGMAQTLADLKPDLLLVLGDRYEILCCCVAATLARIPIAHIAGGDITEGAFDDNFRHAISKMAHLHFATNPDAARRLRQMGEQAEYIHVTGSPGLDLVRTTQIPLRAEFFAAIGMTPAQKNIVVTFHPVTLANDSLAQLQEMLAALRALNDTGILFTGSNSDPQGRSIDAAVQDFVAGHPNAKFHASLGTRLYFAALTHMDAVVGNSSSGLYEAPSFGVPTVNIGDRQSGRLKAASVTDCAPERGAIAAAVHRALTNGRRPAENPYGDGHASEKILAVLKSVTDPAQLLQKKFIDLASA